MRTYQHIIDTKAVRQTINSIPEHCVVRGLSERDYGIDLMVEIFNEVGVNAQGHTIYDTSGHVCYLQIKGVNNELRINDDSTISLSIERDAFLYAEKFSTPFVLIRACTLEGHEVVYFLWMQRYISEKLDYDNPSWRTNAPNSFTIKIPINNKLPDNFEKIENIAARIKYVEDFTEFYERFSDMELHFLDLITSPKTYAGFDFLLKEFNRIKRLTTLLNFNNCCINRDSIDNLINILVDLKNDNTISITELTKENDYHNINLLYQSGDSLRFMEELEAKMKAVTVY